MTKVFLLIFTLLSLTSGTVSNLLNDFHSLKSESEELAFIAQYGSESSATYQAYVCGMEMKQATHAFNPFKKLSIFSASKNRLESLIQKSPKNIHLRYVRYLVQINIPAILGYKDNLAEDKELLLNYIKLKPADDTLSKYIKLNCSL